jgi:hypothetical protein
MLIFGQCVRQKAVYTAIFLMNGLVILRYDGQLKRRDILNLDDSEDTRRRAPALSRYTVVDSRYYNFSNIELFSYFENSYFYSNS